MRAVWLVTNDLRLDTFFFSEKNEYPSKKRLLFLRGVLDLLFSFSFCLYIFGRAYHLPDRRNQHLIVQTPEVVWTTAYRNQLGRTTGYEVYGMKKPGTYARRQWYI